MSVTVRKNLCPQNHPCPAVRVCPVGALTQMGFSAPSVDESKCTDCGKCVKTCPTGALVIAKQQILER
jgi:ferredoxin